MISSELIYLVFGTLLLLAVIFDLGLLSKKSTIISIKKAFWQTLFWVSLAFAFGGFLWFSEGKTSSLEYVSAYLMEWSLSIDNIFVFILIFTYFRIHADHIARALLIGILMAIVFRIIFITVGVVLVQRFEWLLYIFGAFLVYTGIKIFTVKQEGEYDPVKNPVYRFINRFLPIINEDISGKLTVKKNGKRFYTNLFVVIIMLATTDIVFALDSIPAVFAIVTDSPNKHLIIYTSNIFAVLGLRSLFFLLQVAVNQFKYLQQSIAVVLIFIGLKMLAEIVKVHVPVGVSLMVIVVCIVGSIIYSVQTAEEEKENSEL
ncbi:MAG: tellurium resistance protein TerC [Chitinophagaceae bacterium]